MALLLCQYGSGELGVRLWPYLSVSMGVVSWELDRGPTSVSMGVVSWALDCGPTSPSVWAW